MRGEAFRELGDHISAIRDYTKAIISDSNRADAYLKRSICEIALSKFENACLDLSKAKQMGLFEADSLIKEYCQ